MVEKKDEAVHLNGSSQRFLKEFAELREEFVVVREKLENHLEHSAKHDEVVEKKLFGIEEKVDGFMAIVTKHENVYVALKAIGLLIVGGLITWGFKFLG